MNFATLQHSIFLQALGGAILNSLWQGFIIWIVYETINASYKNASSAFKNKLSTFLIFISFGWFLSNFINGLYVDESLSSLVSPGSIALEESLKGSAFSIQSVISFAAGTLPYLSVSYIFLLVFLMFKLFSSYRYVYFIANKNLISPPSELQHFALKVATQLKITKKISVWISNHIDVPATVGFLKPVILIPVASLNNLSSLQLEAIILHELSHIKRNDYLINLFISVIETILFFNPFILLLSKTVKRERENCCDDFVIQYQYDRHSYASALLRLEQSRKSNLQLAIAAVSGKKQLLTRVKRITTGKTPSKQFNYGQKLLALLLVTFIICSIAWLSPQDKKINLNKSPLKDLKTITKQAVTIGEKPGENINTKNQANETKRTAGALHNNEVVEPKPGLIPQLDLLQQGKDDFDGVSEEIAFEKNKTDPKKKEFYFFNDTNSGHPKLFFDQNILTYVPLKLLENYSLKNLNGDIDIDELNKSLKEAYAGINAMDWKKIQNEINESFNKLRADQFSHQEIGELYEENLKHLFDTRKEKLKLQINTPSELRKKIILIDSLGTVEIARAPKPHRQADERWESSKTDERHPGNGSNFNYYFMPTPLPNVDLSELPKSKPPKFISISGLKNKNTAVIADKLAQPHKESKNSFHFVISNNTNGNEGQKIIRVEITETP